MKNIEIYESFLDRSKQDIIEGAKEILNTNGLEDGVDYIISLQGPTVILTVEGSKKITPEIKAMVESTGIKFMF